MRDEARNEIETAERNLREGQQAFAAALRALDDPEVVPEDMSLDPVSIAHALEQVRLAAAGFARTGSLRLEAHALLEQAEVLTRAPESAGETRAAYTQAEQCARGAFERLDSALDPEPAVRALLLQVEAGAHLMSASDQREQRLLRFSALLDGAAYLAAELGDPMLAAQVGARSARVLAERFTPERDENLLDAIRYGEHAIERMREIPAARVFELPLLLNDLGNCAMKVGGDRSRWLQRGREWYREGAAAVDARRYPRLHRLLAGNVSMADALLEHDDHALPEKEMVARYAVGVQGALEKQDFAQARSLSWGFLAWAWSLPRSPNVHVGEAHKLLAKVALSRGDWNDAQNHLYHSIGVLAAVLPANAPWYHLVGEARALFSQVLQHNGLEATQDSWLARAEQSLLVANAACQRGGALIASDPAAALLHFEQALDVFPCHPTGYFYRAVIRMTNGDWTGAASDLDSAIMLRPKSVPARANRATVRRRLGDLDGSLADLNEAVEIEPRNVGLLRTRAGLHEQRGNQDKAMEDLEAALKAAPDPQIKAEVEQHLLTLRGR
jgi:tetratricopeptide (TPR) repeat protein